MRRCKDQCRGHGSDAGCCPCQRGIAVRDKNLRAVREMSTRRRHRVALIHVRSGQPLFARVRYARNELSFDLTASADIDVAQMARLLGISRRIVRESIWHTVNGESHFRRFCPRCMSAAYHSPLLQPERHAYCPFTARRCAMSVAARQSMFGLRARRTVARCAVSLQALWQCYSSPGYAPPKVCRCLAPPARAVVTRAAIC